MNVDELDAVADRSKQGWAGITDRSFTRRNLDGRIVVENDATQYVGTYADGQFRVTKRCQASDGNTM